MIDARRFELTTSYCVGRTLISNILALSLVLFLVSLSTGCGPALQSANSSSSSSSSNSSTALSLTPGTASLVSLERLQFTAKLSGTPNTAVTWSASAGTISSTGLFTAPKVATNTTVVVTATSSAGPVSKPVLGAGGSSTPQTNGLPLHGYATVTISGPTNAALAVANSSLPSADANLPYSAPLSATGGVAPYKWTLASGTLPSGIQLNSSSGVISGMTSLVGSYPLAAKVTDNSGHTATAAFNLSVSSSSTNGFDAAAELPRVYIQTAMSNSPAPGSTTTVNSAGALQSALNSATCGDTIQLQAGTTFIGPFTFPAKSCDDNHWIIVRTSASDSALPAEGTRLTPCYAGVSSLPGRPSFHCASTKNVLAKLVMPMPSSGPIIFAAGANHYRLIGLEVTRTAGIGVVNALASMAANATADNLTFDRMWFHGTAQDETTRGVQLDGSTYASVVDSFFTDFHCISVSGSCTDAQAVSGGVGNEPMGPYKITNNFLEASGESILFGGGGASETPADIQVSQNHMFKPLTWLKGQPGYVGGKNGNPFIVKNLFELKNAQRVLLEGNIMENTWGGFSQVGFAIVITPKNPGIATPCTVCQVTDVTIRYNAISHVGAGLQIANALSDNHTSALEGQRYSIHDITVDDINGTLYNGPSELAQVSVDAGAPLLQNVTINHVTAFPTSTLFIIGDFVGISAPMKNFAFSNSIVNATVYPMWSTGGGSTNCAYSDNPATTFNTCFATSVFATNAIIAPPPAYPSTRWPARNFFPLSTSSVGFVNYHGGNGGDYHLQSSSPYKGKGTDGKDLGADIDAILSATAGVQ